MASNLNLWQGIGRLGADPEFRDTKAGRVCNLRIATSEYIPKGNGKFDEITEWHNASIWDPAAKAAQRLRVGDLVYASGKLKSRKGSNGVTYWEIALKEIKRLSSKRDENGSADTTDTTDKVDQVISDQAERGSEKLVQQKSAFDDELPF